MRGRARTDRSDRSDCARPRSRLRRSAVMIAAAARSSRSRVPQSRASGAFTVKGRLRILNRRGGQFLTGADIHELSRAGPELPANDPIESRRGDRAGGGAERRVRRPTICSMIGTRGLRKLLRLLRRILRPSLAGARNLPDPPAGQAGRGIAVATPSTQSLRVMGTTLMRRTGSATRPHPEGRCDVAAAFNGDNISVR
jgi:hypothetical protein